MMFAMLGDRKQVVLDGYPVSTLPSCKKARLYPESRPGGLLRCQEQLHCKKQHLSRKVAQSCQNEVFLSQGVFRAVWEHNLGNF